MVSYDLSSIFECLGFYQNFAALVIPGYGLAWINSNDLVPITQYKTPTSDQSIIDSTIRKIEFGRSYKTIQYLEFDATLRQLNLVNFDMNMNDTMVILKQLTQEEIEVQMKYEMFEKYFKLLQPYALRWKALRLVECAHKSLFDLAILLQVQNIFRC